MAKPRDKSPEALRELSDYYKLNTQCVEDLVTANQENSPPVSKEELGQYRSVSGFHLSRCLKAVLEHLDGVTGNVARLNIRKNVSDT